MLLSLSRYRTPAYLCENHDVQVTDWKSNIEQEMKSSKSIISFFMKVMSVLYCVIFLYHRVSLVLPVLITHVQKHYNHI